MNICKNLVARILSPPKAACTLTPGGFAVVNHLHGCIKLRRDQVGEKWNSILVIYYTLISYTLKRNINKKMRDMINDVIKKWTRKKQH